MEYCRDSMVSGGREGGREGGRREGGREGGRDGRKGGREGGREKGERERGREREGGRKEGRMNAVWWMFLMRLWSSFSVLEGGRVEMDVQRDVNRRRRWEGQHYRKWW